MSMKLRAAATLSKTTARSKISLRPLSSKAGGPKSDEDEKPVIQHLPLEQSEAVPAMMVDLSCQNVEQLSLLRKIELRNKSQNPFGNPFRLRDEIDGVGRGFRVLELRDVSDIEARQKKLNKRYSELKGSLSAMQKKLKRAKARLPFVFATGVVSGVSVTVIGMSLWKWVS